MPIMSRTVSRLKQAVPWPSGPARALLLRGLLVLAVLAGCLLLLGQRMSGIRPTQVMEAMAAIPVGACVAALAFGLLSHVAVSGYDLLAFTRIGRRVPWPRALAGGFSGTVMAEVLGFGLVTGSLARARIYRANGIGAAEALAISGIVAAGFFAGLALLLALLLLWDPTVAARITGLPPGGIRALALVALAVMAVGAALGTLRPRRLRAGRLDLRIPDARWLAKAALLAAADLVPAALCLAIMLPAGTLPPLAGFVAIYITGLALGYLVGSPGAAGPFEGILFLALPGVAPADLAAGILMYRFIYYLPPLAAALVLILRAPSAPRTPLLSGPPLRERIAWTMDSASQAEAELVLLGDKHAYFPVEGQGFVFYGISGRIWLVMGDPVAPRAAWDSLAAGIEAEARAAGATLAIYKASARARPMWETRGYHLQSLGEEAAVSLPGWSPEAPARRELRRKTRGARKAGVTLRRHRPGAHPVEEMAHVARAWHDSKGGQQSFSMGHWAPAFNRRHMAVTAWQGESLIAFATVWVSGDGREWMLDLMRQRPEAPNGTMYAIMAEAIAMASEGGASSFNLCMAPLSGLDRADPPGLLSRLGHRAYTGLNHRHGLQGMRRFKEVFRPDWSARYLAVPHPLILPEALLAARQLVHRQTAPGECGGLRTPWLAPLPGAASAWPEQAGTRRPRKSAHRAA
ncbi:bifunctional lysylphosphatidylglycerol flippase/synthetase MprF [Marinibacterium profundimaris]|uniref:Phosphatidylglycerol lysyltransferase n=1 Tax=Marinibacterium profundimaris TaxID=1679460 RepID=A0A225NHU9_9RHOB|nr:phosphatidylglycerol lysyltransferase domain-containing protein [Marinibacterium profundimaris]OWU73432.1 hypothetical protein ATO3_12190 [Marinibacterium profundimaris]